MLSSVNVELDELELELELELLLELSLEELELELELAALAKLAPSTTLSSTSMPIFANSVGSVFKQLYISLGKEMSERSKYAL